MFDRVGRQIETRSVITGERERSYEYAGEHLIRITDADGNSVRFERNGAGLLTAIVGTDGERSTLHYDGESRLSEVVTPGGLRHQMAYDTRPGLTRLLTAYTSPNGHTDRFAYDTRGKLVQNIDPAGGGWQLRSEVAGDTYTATQTVTLTSAEGRETHYLRPLRNWGGQTVTGPDGLASQWQGNSGWQGSSYWTGKSPDGSSTSVTLSPDSRYGMLAPRESRRIDFGGGLSQYSTVTRSYGGSSWSESVSLGGRTLTTHYAARTVESHGPLGLLSHVDVDTRLRPLVVQLPGLAGISLSYDTRGRLIEQRSSGNAGTRYRKLANSSCAGNCDRNACEPSSGDNRNAYCQNSSPSRYSLPINSTTDVFNFEQSQFTHFNPPIFAQQPLRLGVGDVVEFLRGGQNAFQRRFQLHQQRIGIGNHLLMLCNASRRQRGIGMGEGAAAHGYRAAL